jgi:SAM-dependent methyltransferase
MSSAAVWHEVECGGYAADLEVWEELAEAGGGTALELGCGTGRVSLRLARRGHPVWAVDADPALLDALEARASREGLAIRTACADVRALALDRRFELIVAPMQLVQMLGGEAGRRAVLGHAATHLSSAGRLAAAIVERPAASVERATAALPDVRERHGWVYSSLPTIVPMAGGDLEIRRVRQTVSPDGSLSQEGHVDHLDALDADRLEREASSCGLRPAARLEVPPAEGYLGATVVVLGSAA